jgi:hypothetical protein
MNELLKKITDEKVKDTLDKMLGNQCDSLFKRFEDPVYREYREKYYTQLKINEEKFREESEQYNSRWRPNSFLMTWKEVEYKYTSPEKCIFYKIKDKIGESICMAVLILSKGTKNCLPDIRIAYVKKHPKDKSDFEYAKKLAFDRVRQVLYKDSNNGISDGEMNFHVSKKTKAAIESVKRELINKFDVKPPVFEKPYFKDKKYEKYQSIDRPESMLKLVRSVMPKICANEYVTILPETEKDKIFYLRGQK